MEAMEDMALMMCRTNKDLDPVPRHERKWGVMSFVAYWISDAFKYVSSKFNLLIYVY